MQSIHVSSPPHQRGAAPMAIEANLSRLSPSSVAPTQCTPTASGSMFAVCTPPAPAVLSAGPAGSPPNTRFSPSQPRHGHPSHPVSVDSIASYPGEQPQGGAVLVVSQQPKSRDRCMHAFAAGKDAFLHNHGPRPEDASPGEAFPWTYEPGYSCGQPAWPSQGAPAIGEGRGKIGAADRPFVSRYSESEQPGRCLDDYRSPEGVQDPAVPRQETDRNFLHPLPPESGAPSDASCGRVAHPRPSMSGTVYYESATPYPGPNVSYGYAFAPSFSGPAPYTACTPVQSQQRFPAPFSFPVSADNSYNSASSFPPAFARVQEPAALSPSSQGLPQDPQLPTGASSPKRGTAGARKARRRSPKAPRRSPQAGRASKTGSGAAGGTSRPVRGLPLQQRKLYRHFARQTPRVQGLTFDHNQIRWISYWKNDQGRQIQRHFPVSRHGFLEARRLALEERNRILGWPLHTDEAAEAIEALKAAADPFVQQLLMCPPSVSASSVAAGLSEGAAFNACTVVDGDRPVDHETSTASWADEEERPLHRAQGKLAGEAPEPEGERGALDASDAEESGGTQTVLGGEEAGERSRESRGTEPNANLPLGPAAWSRGERDEAREDEVCGDSLVRPQEASDREATRAVQSTAGEVCSGPRASQEGDCPQQTECDSGAGLDPMVASSLGFARAACETVSPDPGSRTPPASSPNHSGLAESSPPLPRGCQTMPDHPGPCACSASSEGCASSVAAGPGPSFASNSDPSSSHEARPGTAPGSSGFPSGDFSAPSGPDSGAGPRAAKPKAPRRPAAHPAARKQGEGVKKSSGSRRRKVKASSPFLASSGLPSAYSVPPPSPEVTPAASDFSPSPVEPDTLEEGTGSALSLQLADAHAFLPRGETSAPCLSARAPGPATPDLAPAAHTPHSLFMPVPEGASRPALAGPAFQGMGAAALGTQAEQAFRVSAARPSQPFPACGTPFQSGYLSSRFYPAHGDFDPFTLFNAQLGLFWEQQEQQLLQLQQLEHQAEVVAGKVTSRKRRRGDSKGAGGRAGGRGTRGPQSKPRERKKSTSTSRAAEQGASLHAHDDAAESETKSRADATEGCEASDEEPARSRSPGSRRCASPSQARVSTSAEQASPARSSPSSHSLPSCSRSQLPFASGSEGSYHLPSPTASLPTHAGHATHSGTHPTAGGARLPFLTSFLDADRMSHDEQRFPDLQSPAAESGARRFYRGETEDGSAGARGPESSREESTAHASATWGVENLGTGAYPRRELSAAFQSHSLSDVACALPESPRASFFCGAGPAGPGGSRAASTTAEAPFLPTTTTADGCGSQLACSFGSQKAGHVSKRRNSVGLFSSLSRSSTTFDLLPVTPAEPREDALRMPRRGDGDQRDERDERRGSSETEDSARAARFEKEAAFRTPEQTYAEWLRPARDAGNADGNSRRQSACAADSKEAGRREQVGACEDHGESGASSVETPDSTGVLPSGVSSMFQLPSFNRCDTTTTDDAFGAPLSFLPSVSPLFFRDLQKATPHPSVESAHLVAPPATLRPGSPSRTSGPEPPEGDSLRGGPRAAAPPFDFYSEFAAVSPLAPAAQTAPAVAWGERGAGRLPEDAKEKVWAQEPFFSPLISFSSSSTFSGQKLRRVSSTDGSVPFLADRLFEEAHAWARSCLPETEEERRREGNKRHRRRSGSLSLARRSSWTSASCCSPRFLRDSLLASTVVGPSGKGPLLSSRELGIAGKETQVSREDSLSSVFYGKHSDTLEASTAVLPPLRPPLSLLSPRRVSYTGDSPFDFFQLSHKEKRSTGPSKSRLSSSSSISALSSLAALPPLSSLSSPSCLSSSLCAFSATGLAAQAESMTRLISLGDTRTVSSVSAGLLVDAGRRDTAFLMREETGELSAFEEHEKSFLDV
ncbi:AP2 domain transcription factor AP2XII-9 [Toxoplasma gondii MAS]|uniref:AP2 domain transcription factor AP2XII-9 n=2 Tax=Toxoplasma gondii TaxID=5811 RepID=A0A086PWK6_TOXGO|nr:AP2 domain transcription factor AP2XII-9 [Toxoplasma gondii MAS]PUA83840.1 AP2 domain transcription factor AP2XII-9 [Toxoplasma gondii TgCATBr9]